LNSSTWAHGINLMVGWEVKINGFLIQGLFISK